jgi:acyl-CoA thioesterase
VTSQFDDDVRVVRVREHVYSATVSPRWNVGPIPNGGYLLAIAANAMGEVVPGRDVRTITVHFLRPAKNAPVEVHVEPVKVGRRFATLAAKMIQDGEHARVLATFATPEVGEGPRVSAPPPVLPPPEASRSVEFLASPSASASTFATPKRAPGSSREGALRSRASRRGCGFPMGASPTCSLFR